MKTSEAASEISFRFGPFLLDPAGGMLLRDGERILLPAKAFETLLVLVEHRGTVVAKETLFARVWRGTSVEENNLAQSISVLRKALGDQGPEYRYIVTSPGRGYSFVAQVIATGGDGFPAARKLPFHPAWLLALMAGSCTTPGVKARGVSGGDRWPAVRNRWFWVRSRAPGIGKW